MKRINLLKIGIFSLILITVLLRVYNFPNRWNLSQDESRDAAIGLQALSIRQLPLIGSFSSAGPFVFGPLFYWFVMASFVIFPFTAYAPWIATLTVGLLIVGVLAYIGKIIGGKKLAVVTVLVAATSPQLVFRSQALTQHTFVAFFTSLLILFFVLFAKTKKSVFSFLMGASLGTAISFHYQSLNLLIFFFLIFLLPKIDIVTKIKAFLIMCFGFLLPSIPLLIWDSGQNFANLRNLADYFLIGQSRFYVASSWKLFLFSFFPGYWAYVSGGIFLAGIFLMFGSIINSVISIFGQIRKEKWLTIEGTLSVAFIVMLILNRYYKGERFEGYLLYLAPFLVLATSQLFIRVFSLNRYLGTVLLTLVVFLNLSIVVPNILNSNSNWAAVDASKKYLLKTFPDESVLVYDQGLQYTGMSQGLGYLIAFDKINKSQSHKIGVCGSCHTNYPLVGKIGQYDLVDLNSVTDLNAGGWHLVSAAGMHNDLIGWSQKNKLPSGFDPIKYLYERLP